RESSSESEAFLAAASRRMAGSIQKRLGLSDAFWPRPIWACRGIGSSEPTAPFPKGWSSAGCSPRRVCRCTAIGSISTERGRRIQEELYLTSFLWEEAKHVEFFRRWLDQVAIARGDLGHYLTSSYRQLFLVELPSSLNALKSDPSVEAQIRASVTYNMIIEGVL